MRLFIRIFNSFVAVNTVASLLAAGAFVIPQAFGINPYIVLSGSMEPEIHTGAVEIVNTKDTEVEAGDIVTYRIPKTDGSEALVTHRIVGEDEDGFITKGDANDTEDMTRVTQAQIVGTCMDSIPMLGYLLADRKLIVVAAGWLFLFNVFSIVLSRVSNMSGMFRRCNYLSDINGLSAWNTENVTDMSNMFSGCSSLADPTDVSSIND